MSYLSQMAGLAVQQFVSAGVGMAVLAAVIRGLTRRSTKTLGNFWRTSTARASTSCSRSRSCSRIALSSQGVPQTFDGAATATTIEGAEQTIARGPVASHDRDQAARDERRRLLQLELRGAVREPERLHEHPRDAGDPADPGRPGLHVREDGRRQTPGLRDLRRHVRHVRDRRGGDHSARAARVAGAQRLRVDLSAGDGQSGGNMSDKEVRFGIANTGLWAVATTNASNGSVNGGHDALTAGGGAVPITNMFTGEVSSAASAPASTGCSSTSSSPCSSPG